MIILPNADVIKSTWLFILRLKFLFSEILLDDVWKKNIPEESKWIENKEQKSFHSTYARCTGEGCLLDYRVSNMSRTQCWKRGESENVKELSRARGMLLFLQKPCWPARLAVCTTERESCSKRVGKRAVEVEAPVGSRGRQS